jgi:hypothetical protein
VTLTDLELETRLRDQRSRTAEIPPPPVDLAQRVRDRAREQHRRRVVLTAAGIAAALVFVGLPTLASGWLPDGSRGESASPSTRSRSAQLPSQIDIPTRGSLAGDDEWLADVRALSWRPENAEFFPPEVELPDPRVEDRKVVFAGDVPGGRVALVMAYTDENRLVQAWFTGRKGSAPRQMRLATTPSEAPGQQPLALVSAPDPASDDAVLVLVAQPGDRAEVRTGREVTAAGETRDLWEPMQLDQGAGGVALGHPMVMPPSLEIRITRPGRSAEVYAQFQFSDQTAVSLPAPVEAVADPRGLLGVTDTDELRWTLESLVSEYGRPADELRPTLLFGGPVTAGSTTSVVLVGVTFPSGATTTSLAVYWGSDDGGMSITTSSADPAPAGVALLDRLIAVATSNAVVVSGPTTGVEAQVYRQDGTLLTTVPLVEGAGSAALAPPSRPYGRALLTVRVLDGAGNVVGETTAEQQG